MIVQLTFPQPQFRIYQREATRTVSVSLSINIYIYLSHVSFQTVPVTLPYAQQ